MKKHMTAIWALLGMLIIMPGAKAQQSTNSEPAMLDGTEAAFFSSAQKVSRDSAVKIEGMFGGHGSGTYVQLNGHYLVITAKHVVDTSDIYYIRTSTEKVVGQVIWTSRSKDMAVLRVPALRSRKAVALARSGDLSVGDSIVYTGYPSSYELLTAKGQVSGHTGHRESTLVQGFVWFGYSGSGAFDRSGRLRAIVYGIAVENYRGLPQFLETLVYTHEIERSDITEIGKALIAPVDATP